MTTYMTEMKFFRSDCLTSEKPHIWFCKLEAHFDKLTSMASKLYKFQKNLEPGNRVETWYKSVPTESKATWDLFYVAFTAKWPMLKSAEPTHEELMERLSSLILLEELLGHLVGMGDKDRMHSHVAWAEDVCGVVSALDNPQGYLIPLVCGNLPPFHVHAAPTDRTGSHFPTDRLPG